MEVKLVLPQRGQERAAVDHEPVIVVHGTFANPVPQDLRRSPLGTGRQLLPQPGCRPDAPRIASPVLGEIGETGLRWTGDNLEVARRAAARELTAYPKKIEQDPAIKRYHLVAHSHGGNVVYIALRSAQEWPKLGCLVYLATPFLHFGAEPDRPGTAAEMLLTPEAWLPPKPTCKSTISCVA